MAVSGGAGDDGSRMGPEAAGRSGTGPRPGTGRRPGVEQLWQTLDWLGLVDELATRRIDRTLRAAGLTFPQFVLLSHFTQAPGRPRTLTRIARALRANQPKITKRARQLVERGYLHVQPGATDRRVKRLTTTPAGRAAFRAAGARLAPEIERMFADWDTDDVERLNTHLFRLKTWLDQNQNDHRSAVEPPPADDL